MSKVVSVRLKEKVIEKLRMIAGDKPLSQVFTEMIEATWQGSKAEMELFKRLDYTTDMLRSHVLKLISQGEKAKELERQLLYITYLIEEDVRVRLLRSENFERYLEKVKERMKNEGY